MPDSGHRIAAYVPRLLRGWIAAEPSTRWREVDGTLVLADISEFTQLSERLARRGKIGAEQLTETIDGCFARLLGAAGRHGGSLLKFGGDALLLLFHGAGHPLHAARAAVTMRSALESISTGGTPAGRVRLEMSVGIHTGVMHVFVVGASHRELLIAGPDASETVRVEAAAGAGEIVVSERTAAALPAAVLGAGRAAGRLLDAAPEGEERPLQPDQPLDDMAVLPFVPAALRSHVSGPHHDPEHRRVSVAFLGFRGLDARVAAGGGEPASALLDALIGNVQQAADPHGVTFLATDIDRDGGKIILASGAPQTRGNDEERMLLALREIVEMDHPLPVHAGVHAGHVFAGAVGPPERRTYTVMGDAVNLAARLMAQAGRGELLATQTVLANSRTTFHTEGLEPFTVKGKRDPVHAERVGPVAGSRAASELARLPLLGRVTELAVFDQVLQAARERRGGIIDVVGEAGIGKTRLVEAFAEQASGLAVHPVRCELYRASTPYAPVRRLLRALVGIPEAADDSEAAAVLQATLSEDHPELLPWAPLLGIPLDVELPPTQETAAIGDEHRRRWVHDTTVRLLQGLLTGPTLIIVEDTQWLDDASTALLHDIGLRAGEHPWVLCLTRRDDDPALVDDTTVTRIRLAPLDTGATTVLAQAATDDSPLPPHELATLVQRCGGNPLFLQELLAAVRTGGFDALPDSVEALVTARIDQLPHDARSLLRYLSVLGQSFARDLVAAVADDDRALDEERTWAQLGEFLTRDDETIAFRHVLIRDVAYEALPYRRRRQLHARVGDVIARTRAGEPELLSFHYFLAGRHEEAWEHSLTAAENAAAIYANAEAVRFYRRAVEAGREVPELAPSAVVRVREALGDVLQLMGDVESAGSAYAGARRKASGDAIAVARLLLKQARVQAWLRRYSQAKGLVTRGLRHLEGSESRDAQRQRAQLMVWYGHFCQEQGRHAEALRWAQRAITAAEACDERVSLANAYKLLDWIHADRGELDKAVYSARALALYEELGDLSSQAKVLNNLGGIAYWQGRWNEARELYERAQELDERTGDVIGGAFRRNNIGEILLDQGRLDEAEELFREAERVFRAARYRGAIAYTRAYLGRAAARAGRVDEALRLLAEARAVWKDVGAEVQTLEADARIAECHLLRGAAHTALELADSILARARTRDGVAAQSPLVHRVRGQALMQLRRFDAARTALEASLDAAAARDADYEVALTQRVLARLAAAEDRPVPHALIAHSQAVFERLGVQHLPPLAPAADEPATADR